MNAMLNLSKFDLSRIGSGRVVCIVGKRNSGKSVLVRDIMFHKRHVPAGVVMSGTEDGNRYYGEFVPDSFIYHDFDERALVKLVGRQRRLAREGRASDVFVVLDDVVYDNKIFKSKVMKQLFFNGRHWKIFLIITTQFATSLPVEYRANCDYVIAFREPIFVNREKLHKYYFGIFPKMRAFELVFQKCTNDYEVLVSDNTVQSNKIEDCVYWYKAALHPPFRVGHAMFWDYHNRRYNPAADDDGGGGGGAVVRRIA